MEIFYVVEYYYTSSNFTARFKKLRDALNFYHGLIAECDSNIKSISFYELINGDKIRLEPSDVLDELDVDFTVYDSREALPF